MAWLSFTKLATLLAMSYIVYSLSSFYKIFHLDQCADGPLCIHPKFQIDLDYQLVITGKASSMRSEQLLLEESRVKMNGSFSRTVVFAVPRAVSRNKTYLVKAALTPIINGVPALEHAVMVTMSLTRLKVPVATAYNLLSQNETQLPQRPSDRSAASPEMHLFNRVVLTTLAEPVVFHYHKVPQELHSLLKVTNQQHRGTDKLVYAPIAYLNTFVLSDDDLVRVSSANSQNIDGSVHKKVETVNITIEMLPVSLGKLRLWRLIEHATDDLATLGFNNKSVDSVRAIFTHTNFYLLVMTFTVAALHLLFDVLSFKNDISFWRAARTTQGLSGRTVMWRCVSSVIVFLYLVEEETSLLVLVPFAISTVIEFWKLFRVLKVRVSLSGRPLSIDARDSGEQLTDNIDGEGMRYLLWLVTPLCVGGAVYSLLYLPHKSWYSWTVNTMANGVYMFGFLFMTPQLFINYRLKSVAHLPWKALTYKAFNTFIDDFFAFIITMPTGHRLACFRDDIIFVVYIYQRWLYPVDKTRVNEFGQTFDKPADHHGVSVSNNDMDSRGDKKTQ